MSRDIPEHMQDVVQTESLRNPESFWMKHAEDLLWQRKPEHAVSRGHKTLPSGASHPTWTYFPGGEINTSYNCIDRHVLNGNGSRTAIIYDSPVAGVKQKITYDQLLEEVELLAAVLKNDCGVKKGDTVLIYMPMIPQAVYAMLASSRIGAIHAVVFGGFAAKSLAQRIDSARPKVILTASCGLEGAEKIISYRRFIEGAYDQSSHKPNFLLAFERKQQKWGSLDQARGELAWQTLIDRKRSEGRRETGTAVKSEDGLYIIYTSGEQVFTNTKFAHIRNRSSVHTLVTAGLFLEKT